MMKGFTRVVLLAAALVTAAGCSDSGSSDGNDCDADSECKGDRVCADHVCVDPATDGASSAGPATGASAASAGGGATSSSSGMPACLSIGAACLGSEQCCGYTESGTPQAACLDSYSGKTLCVPSCSEGHPCETGCCYEVPGESFGLCDLCT